MQGLGSVTGQIDPTEKVAARDDAYTAGPDVCCPGLDLCNFAKLRRTPMPCKLATCCICIKIAANIKFMT